ncbi:MAG: cardiolipin synthase ClsB [Zoogloeaceae bacterium]|jgi:cardiolipin synthase|nr:cardiolipin synthase ClsB [Zoogloeaceae bacterium]
MTEFTGGNHITLLRCGQDYFPALLQAIAAARREIFLQTYIFADDAIGQAVAAALVNAARRGVKARVLVDGFGARNFVAAFGDMLRAAGVATLVFRAEIARFPGVFRLRRHRLRRLHRKLVAIDGRVAFVGGINIIDDRNVPAHIGPRLDYSVRIEGPLLVPIWNTLRRDWEKVAWVSFRRRDRLSANDLPRPQVAGFQQAAFLLRNSVRHRNTIANAYLEAMRAARVSIVVANAYFFPGLRFRRALTNAARRGIRVTVLLQGKSDHPVLHYATQALYGLLLRAGVRIFEYQRGFLHAKVAVIDQKWATVGSFNIDPFSLLLARESNVAVLDRQFAAELEASLQQVIANDAQELTLNALGRQSWRIRLLRWVCYGLVYLMTALGVRGQKVEEQGS